MKNLLSKEGWCFSTLLHSHQHSMRWEVSLLQVNQTSMSLRGPKLTHCYITAMIDEKIDNWQGGAFDSIREWFVFFFFFLWLGSAPWARSHVDISKLCRALLWMSKCYLTGHFLDRHGSFDHLRIDGNSRAISWLISHPPFKKLCMQSSVT